MNKTIERVFYVDRASLDLLVQPSWRYIEPLLWKDNEGEKKIHKIKIIIEVPERETTIREGDIERYLEEWKYNPSYSDCFAKYLKQKLFAGG